MRQLAIIVTFCLIYLCHTKTIYFSDSGEYILTPEMYNFSDNFTVEVIGAGSGSYTQWNVKKDDFEGCISVSGNSGGFIYAFIITNQNNFTLYVGKGSEPESKKNANMDGEDTTLSNDNVKMIARGGYFNSFECIENDTICPPNRNIVNITHGHGHLLRSIGNRYGHIRANRHFPPNIIGPVVLDSGRFEDSYSPENGAGGCVQHSIPTKGGDGLIRIFVDDIKNDNDKNNNTNDKNDNCMLKQVAIYTLIFNTISIISIKTGFFHIPSEMDKILCVCSLLGIYIGIIILR